MQTASSAAYAQQMPPGASRLPKRGVSRHHVRHTAASKRRERSCMRSRDDIAAAVEAHADTVLRATSVYLREQADREDAFQETFLRYARSETSFADEEHKKAWLIRVAINVCKDMLKSASAQVASLDEAGEAGFAPVGDDGEEGQRQLEAEELLAALGQLDERYRTALYLKYYEGMTAAEIAREQGLPENTVYTNLSRGKKQLLGVLRHGRI